MSEDYVRHFGILQGQNKTYIQINSMLQTEGKSLADFPQMEQLNEYEEEEDYMTFEKIMEVDEINKRVVELLGVTGERIYTSIDCTVNGDNDDIGEALLPEYLNSLSPPSLPPHELRLKPNCIIMLIRNLSINEGLCNGTRLMVIELADHLLNALSSATYPYYAAAAAAAAAAAGVAGVGGVGGVGSAGQLGYWYPPQSYPTTATQMQAGGFLQGMQGYTYGQFAGYQQAQYMGMGMGAVHAAGTAAGWGQGLPGGPQLPPHHATTVTAPPGVQAAPPPPPPPAQMMAYPMQQFQVERARGERGNEDLEWQEGPNSRL
ncbi:uncharacterized protein LOC114942792 [Nylanderia fulva]|uniref:uncharacterized protein LOC114942792 n=1 Tax=Nylanderia fulva TaxID=613905 RepID=UPI0010FAD25F|nr:uncharacterized protein LOC114942792 [Nylanderia fulva]